MVHFRYRGLSVGQQKVSQTTSGVVYQSNTSQSAVWFISQQINTTFDSIAVVCSIRLQQLNSGEGSSPLASAMKRAGQGKKRPPIRTRSIESDGSRSVASASTGQKKTRTRAEQSELEKVDRIPAFPVSWTHAQIASCSGDMQKQLCNWGQCKLTADSLLSLLWVIRCYLRCLGLRVGVGRTYMEYMWRVHV